MRRNTGFAVAAALTLLVAACVDSPSAPPSAVRVDGQPRAITAGTCTTLQSLNTQAKTVFGAGSPDASSVLGKLKTLDGQIKKKNFSGAIATAHNIVDFTLKKNAQHALPGTAAQIRAFINSVYCFAGLDISINEPSNSHLIFPSDTEQVRYAVDLQSAILFDANPVSEPTLVEFQQVPDNFPAPGDGPLDTKLDQYPGFLLITKSSETDAPLTKPAVVGICASGVIPQEVRDRLRLGHGAVAGFEIAPPAPADFLDCENAIAAAPSDNSILSRLARLVMPLVMPKSLHAARATYFAGGGVGGTVTEFSPFAPVDPELKMGGGVGGTVTEFTRDLETATFMPTTALAIVPCAPTKAPAGQEVKPECRPFVTLKTNLGTSLGNVPVSWNVTVGGGAVAPRSAALCGAFAPTVVNPTSLGGVSGICWRMGALGANQVVATPSAGGDAPAGVTFVPATQTFDATALADPYGAPTIIEILSGDNQTATAGVPTPIAPSVRVTDSYGYPVVGTRVHWILYEGTGSVTPSLVNTDGNGISTAAWTLGLGSNQLKTAVDAYQLRYVIFQGTGTAP